MSQYARDQFRSLTVDSRLNDTALTEAWNEQLDDLIEEECLVELSRLREYIQSVVRHKIDAYPASGENAVEEMNRKGMSLGGALIIAEVKEYVESQNKRLGRKRQDRLSKKIVDAIMGCGDDHEQMAADLMEQFDIKPK
jgi:hypothetical protein